MTVIKANFQEPNSEKSVKQVRHVLSDVMKPEGDDGVDEARLFGSSTQSVLRGVKPSKTITLEKIKSVMSAPLVADAEFIPPQRSVASTQSLPAIDTSLYEDEVAAYRVQAQAQIDHELQHYREQALGGMEHEKRAILDRAYQEGFQQGQQEGQHAYLERARGLFEAVNGIEKDRQQGLERMEEDVLQLSVKVAETIVQKELSFDEEAIYSIVKEALVKITDKDKVIIKVNPSETEKVRQRQHDILNLMPDIRSLQISGDERIKPGGCIIETKLGFVDSSISTKLETIELALMDAYQEGNQAY